MKWNLSVDLLTVSFDGLKALDGLSFKIEQGKITALIGPNGAGKTTVFNVITGLLKPNEGEVYFKGQRITNLPPFKRARLGMARTFQLLRLFPQITVLENMLLAQHYSKGERLWAALTRSPSMLKEEEDNRKKALDSLEFVGLAEKANVLAEELSHGQRRLLEIARALATGADLLLLDEPTAGVYPEMRRKILGFLEEIRDQGRTIVFIDHRMETVFSIAEHVIVLAHGKKLAEGSPAAVRRNPKVKKAYLGKNEAARQL
jgi:ABC-type branched-subunit amino acid transport system ATPase component